MQCPCQCFNDMTLTFDMSKFWIAHTHRAVTYNFGVSFYARLKRFFHHYISYQSGFNRLG